jgi:hypothetical protein
MYKPLAISKVLTRNLVLGGCENCETIKKRYRPNLDRYRNGVGLRCCQYATTIPNKIQLDSRIIRILLVLWKKYFLKLRSTV